MGNRDNRPSGARHDLIIRTLARARHEHQMLALPVGKSVSMNNVCMYVCMHACTYQVVHTHVYIYIHTYIYVYRVVCVLQLHV
jgi:hypothetical protein